jgi:hypothetical protein
MINITVLAIAMLLDRGIDGSIGTTEEIEEYEMIDDDYNYVEVGVCYKYVYT